MNLNLIYSFTNINIIQEIELKEKNILYNITPGIFLIQFPCMETLRTTGQNLIV